MPVRLARTQNVVVQFAGHVGLADHHVGGLLAFCVGMEFQINTRLCARSVTKSCWPSEVTDTGENRLLASGGRSSDGGWRRRWSSSARPARSRPAGRWRSEYCSRPARDDFACRRQTGACLESRRLAVRAWTTAVTSSGRLDAVKSVWPSTMSAGTPLVSWNRFPDQNAVVVGIGNYQNLAVRGDSGGDSQTGLRVRLISVVLKSGWPTTTFAEPRLRRADANRASHPLRDLGGGRKQVLRNVVVDHHAVLHRRRLDVVGVHDEQRVCSRRRCRPRRPVRTIEGVPLACAVKVAWPMVNRAAWPVMKSAPKTAVVDRKTRARYFMMLNLGARTQYIKLGRIQDADRFHFLVARERPSTAGLKDVAPDHLVGFQLAIRDRARRARRPPC